MSKRRYDDELNIQVCDALGVGLDEGFSYDVSSGEPDLKEQILKLRAMRNSPYWNRSLADIAGMILLESLPKEIERYEQTEGKQVIAGKRKTK